MSRHSSLREIISPIFERSPEVISNFFRTQSWSTEVKDKLILLSSPPDDEGEKLTFPLPIARTIDYEARILDAFEGLLELSSLDLKALRTQISNFLDNRPTAFQPALSLRFGSESYRSIPLEELEDAVSHSRLAIAHSIDCELSAPRSYRKKPSNDAIRAANSFEFAHTREGSFIIVINAPKHLSSQPNLPAYSAMSENAETRALRRIARGLNVVSKTRAEDLTKVLLERELASGLNANIAINLKKAFSSVSTPEKQISFTFPSSLNETIPLSYPISQGTLWKLDIVFETLMGVNPDLLTMTVVVIGLKSINPLEEEYRHNAMFKIISCPEVKSLEGRTFATNLSKTSYFLALKAHESGMELKLIGNFHIVDDRLVPIGKPTLDA